MKNSFIQELRGLLPAGLGCVLLPLTTIVFCRSDDGKALALGLFFLGCASVVAQVFRRNPDPLPSVELEPQSQVWRKRMMTLSTILFLAATVFSLLCLTLNDPRDFAMVILAYLILIPSICVVPFLTLITGKPFAAVVFTLFLVFCMKLLGGTVVVLLYGWDADMHGHTDMPWMQPNLLVWLFLFNTGVISLVFHRCGARKFQRENGRLVRFDSYAPAN